MMYLCNTLRELRFQYSELKSFVTPACLSLLHVLYFSSDNGTECPANAESDEVTCQVEYWYSHADIMNYNRQARDRLISLGRAQGKQE